MRLAASIIVALFIVFAGPNLRAAAPRPDDAPLHAVQFVDKAEGWAVGDEGAILHTIDAGKTWERQPSGTTASLRRVQMLTPYVGWAVGRVEAPYTRTAQGVVLGTTDGGGTWREVTAQSLPGLNAVQFLDEKNGFAAGDSTDLHPTGAFRTANGGRTWEPLRGPRCVTESGWQALDARSPEQALLVGDATPAVARGTAIARPAALQTLAFGGTAFVRHDGSTLLADRSGLMARLGEDGTHRVVEFPAAKAGFRVTALSAVGAEVWCAGRPGSVVWHSPDFGATWEGFPTPVTTGLRGVQMLDAKTGWAVGDFGVILGTTDGGRTWQTQRSGGQQAAVLQLHARPERIALGLTAKLAADGYHAAAVVLGPGREPRVRAAYRLAGGRTADVDAVKAWPDYLVEPTADRDPKTLADATDPALMARLVLAIRTYRPAMIVTDAVDPKAPSSDLAVLLAAKSAFALAADPAAFPEHLSVLKLTPHAAQTLFGLAAGAAAATVRHDLTAVEPRFGIALKDTIPEATMTLTGHFAAADVVGLRLIAHRLADPSQVKDLVPGPALAEGGPSRTRAMGNAVPPDAAARRATAHALRRELDALPLTTTVEVSTARRLAIFAELNDPRAALIEGERLTAAGQWTAAGAVYSHVREAYPLNVEAVPAMRWLTRYYTSGELRRRLELGQQPIFQKAIWEAVPGADSATQPASFTEATNPRAKFRFAGPEAAQSWDRAALDLELPLAAFGTATVRDLGVQLPWAATRRRLGLNAEAAKALKFLIADNPADPKTDPRTGRLIEELRTLGEDGPGAAYAPRAVAYQAAAKPHLDGKLTDECWRAATVAVLKSPAGYATKARFLFDAEFLYVGVECQHPAGKSVPKAEARGRDDDLTGRDRVELMLDIDRDYATYYRLRVDRSGRAAEDCCGDPTWNPKWFIAVDPQPTGWTAELAIPLGELTGTPKLAGQTWAMNLTRIAPGAACEAWAGPGSATPTPATMGQLRFVGDSPKASEAAK